MAAEGLLCDTSLPRAILEITSFQLFDSRLAAALSGDFMGRFASFTNEFDHVA